MKVLVLSGGAAKGRWQAGVIYELWKQGHTWDAVIGVSVGALNGALVAMGEYELMRDIWTNIRNRDVYTGKLNAWHLLKAAVLGRKGVLGHAPLWKLISRHVHLEKMAIPYQCGLVELERGTIGYGSSTTTGSPTVFLKSILASAMMPVVWEPVMIEPYPGQWVDGGLRDNSPLGKAIKDWQPRHITIINTGSDRMKPGRPKNLIQVASRSLDIVLHEIFQNDIKQFLTINRMVKQAQHQGFGLKKPDGTYYKYFEHALHQPQRPLGELLDFTKYSRFDEGRAAVLN